MATAFNFLFSRRPVYLVYHVTGKCNLFCRHCFNAVDRTAGDKDLSLDEIEQTVRQMGHIKYLTFAGGEPFLRDDLEKIASLFYRHNDIHLLNIVTNGWYTDRIAGFAKSVLEDSPGLHMSIGVSVDGPEEIHDSLRGRQGSWRHAIDTLESLQQFAGTGTEAARRLTVAACGTYNRLNSDSLRSLAGFLRETLAVPFFAGLIRGDTMPEPGLTEIDMDHYMKLLEEINYAQYAGLAENYPFRHIRLAVDQVVSEMIYESRVNKRMTLPCQAGKKGFVLTASGEVLLCEILNRSLGNVRNFGYSPYRILDLAGSQNEIRNIRIRKCHCTWECFQRLNVVFGPSKYPEILRQTIKGIFSG